MNTFLQLLQMLNLVWFCFFVSLFLSSLALLLVKIYLKIILIKISRKSLVLLEGKVSNFLIFFSTWNLAKQLVVRKLVSKPFVYAILRSPIHRIPKGIMFLAIRYKLDVLFFGFMMIMFFDVMYLCLWLWFFAFVLKLHALVEYETTEIAEKAVCFNYLSLRNNVFGFVSPPPENLEIISGWQIKRWKKLEKRVSC